MLMFHSFGQIQIDVVLYNFAINSENHPEFYIYIYKFWGNCFPFCCNNFNRLQWNVGILATTIFIEILSIYDRVYNSLIELYYNINVGYFV